MKLSAKSRYSIMALLDMMENHKDTPVSLVSIAERQKLPLPYLEQIFVNLRKASLVMSSRGAQGGYTFARPINEITLYDVVSAADRVIEAPRCSGMAGGCLPNGVKCRTHHLWAVLDEVQNDCFKKITLSDVCDRTIGHFVFTQVNEERRYAHASVCS